MKERMTIGKICGCFLPMLLALFCQVVISLAGTVLLGVLSVFFPGLVVITEENVITMATDAVMIITAVSTFATLILGAVWYKKYRPKSNLTWKQVVNKRLFAALLLLGISLQLLISLCLNAVLAVLPQTWMEEYSALMETLVGGSILLSVFVTVFLAPLAEEFIFRGIILEKARRFLPFLAANAVQAVLFGIYHMNLIQGVYAFALGMVLGVVAEYFHSIWASVLLHACVNGAAQLLNILPGCFFERASGIVLLVLIGVIFLFVSVKLFPAAKVQETENEKFSENSFDEL